MTFELFVLFVAILSVLIVVHEAGHFLTAKRLGVRVEEFALGFGKKLWSWKHEGTEYRICAVPLGGYVKMAGDERDKCQGKPEEYFSKPAGHRALIVLMGPIVNYAFAYFCFVLVFMIGLVNFEAAMKELPAKIGNVMVSSPAAKAGLSSGDKVVSIDGKDASNWATMTDLILASEGKAMAFVLERDGVRRTVTVKPEVQTTKDVFGRDKPVSRIGVQPAEAKDIEQKHIERYNLLGAMRRAAVELQNVTVQTYTALGDIITGRRSAKEGVTGLIGIFMIIKALSGLGVAVHLHVVGILSASLAIFNLLPLIPLDGGHLALIGLEKLRGKPLSVKTDELIGKIGFGLIIALAVFVFYVDFERIGLIDKVTRMFVR